MADEPHNPNPLVPPTQNMRRYWEALGHFVHEFAHVEKMLASVLWRMAGTTIPIAQAVFSGVRSDAGRQFINRILEATKAEQAIKDEFQFIFTQLGHITDARNTILHYGTEFNEGADFLATNRMVAIDETRVKELPVSAIILNQMTEDLQKINAHLLVLFGRGWIPDENLENWVGSKLRASWRYKPPQPASRGDRTPRTTPKQRRRPGPSQA